ncbi:membrane-bound ClpP family serine protease [Clostridium saccharoperbutylacetonicum]|uniref:Membrane-bound serine protease n=1 Tax=Clostridium saccharoperbutylacetonicum N1-4(HMT) TaxID=931276 RepID=M1MTF1_9CLOT|nr:NfeD family protein [Clostridium saccharoperbutylacetonicum]AGF54842.1 membrane-bound serine protease [Clostridium saccharoperbutylacetonicum N1-4(HMT)]NRT64453.1 membrane-bound ClpP family serine protease [Clostridium saccharoperbutylacetonicum]NSB27824.1 membrane-bound ClpP family serine protease [Clostridium saccharoperbutylacetonicum]NSB41309.1 membrane-bound ClpP family serine protease [Clostridium saccharoperbutylacetonicum]
MSTFLPDITLLTLLLLIIGFGLVFLEMHIPGFGIPGILGAICLILAVALTAQNFAEGLVMTLGILAILGIMLGVVLTFFTKGKFFKPLILPDVQRKEHGYISSSDLDYLLGKKGIALTDLRPSGSIDIDGVKFDVISDGEYISSGTKVEIFKVSGVKLLVKKTKD